MNFIFPVLFLVYIALCQAEIYDPLNVFCGSQSCYDVLDVKADATLKDIKKAYRKLSLTIHPDKNKDQDAVERFRLVSKAYEVLTGNESRPLFDYYLKNPRDYFKVSGQHYYKNLPKSDVRLVVVVVIGLLSWFFHTIQFQKYERVIKYLKNATLNNLSIKNGGTKQTLELYRRAVELYEEYIKEVKSKEKGKIKMLKDPMFEKFVDQVVSEVKVEGGFRKPEWGDLFAVRLVLLPYHLVLWGMKYHRRYISKAPLPLEDKIEMSRDTLGLSAWENFSDEEKEKFIAMEIWKPDVLQNYLDELEAARLKAMKSKSGKRNKKRMEEDEDFEDEYVD